MANEKTLSSYMSVAGVAVGAYFYVIVPDAESDTGYSSYKIAASDLAETFLNDFSFPLLFPKTTASSVVGAFNEQAYKELTGTLTSGSTSVTISDAIITTASTFELFTDVYGVNPTAVTVATGSVTLTFSAQQSDVSVKVRVW